MTCIVCKNGEPKAGYVTVTLTRGQSTVVFRGVPADVCDNCGEYYLSEAIAGDLLQRADSAVQRGAEVEIVRYAA